MKILKISLLIVAALVVVFFGVTFLLPSDIKVQRSIEIDATKDVVFEQVNDFRNWIKWNPWQDIDPNQKHSYSGSKMGKGAIWEWNSKVSDVGVGKQVITESVPYDKISTDLYFYDNKFGQGVFTFSEENGKTKVTQSYSGKLDFFYRWMGIGMEGKLSDQFNTGLNKLKLVSESLPGRKIILSTVQNEPLYVIAIEDSCKMDQALISDKIKGAYGAIIRFMNINDIKSAGAPLVINKFWDKENYIFMAGWPVADTNFVTTGRLQKVAVPGGEYVKAVSIGPYEEIEYAYIKIMDYMNKNKISANGYSYEVYVNDPAQVPKEDLETHIFFPYRKAQTLQ